MWWDFGQDGVWSDPGEQQPVQQGIPAGTSTFFIDVPWAAPTGDTYMRARISSVLTNPTGSAPDGEVEDHQITVVEPPFVRAYVGEDREVALGGTVRVGASPAADGGVPPYTYSWSVDPVTGYSLNAASDPNPAFTPAEVAEFEVCMAVDDSVVGNDEACLTIYSFCAQTVNQDPSFTSDNGFVDYWAAVSIASADYTVMGGGDVAFFAGSSIGLESGFRVESGGRFQATIDPGIDASCGEQAIRRRAPER
jgi:hypothetical protein